MILMIFRVRLGQFFRHSMARSLIKMLLQDLYRGKQVLSGLYRESLLCKIIKSFWHKVVIYFKSSFLARIIEDGQTKMSVLLDASRVVKKTKNTYLGLSKEITVDLNSSQVSVLVNRLSGALRFFSVRTFGIIVFSCAITDILFSFILQRSFGSWGWIIRVSFMLLGIWALLLPEDFLIILNNSIFLSKIKKYQNVRDLR